MSTKYYIQKLRDKIILSDVVTVSSAIAFEMRLDSKVYNLQFRRHGAYIMYFLLLFTTFQINIGPCDR